MIFQLLSTEPQHLTYLVTSEGILDSGVLTNAQMQSDSLVPSYFNTFLQRTDVDGTVIATDIVLHLTPASGLASWDASEQGNAGQYEVAVTCSALGATAKMVVEFRNVVHR